MIRICCKCLWSYIIFSFFQPPLIQAIFSGDPEEIRTLIYKSEDINALVHTRAHAHILCNAHLNKIVLLFKK